MAQRLATGRIIWAEIADANGIRKLRPAVIVTSSDQIAPGKPFDVVAVTSRLTDSLPQDHVPLPWHPRGHPRTGLNRRCAAVCTWLAQLTDGRFARRRGDGDGVSAGPAGAADMVECLTL